MPVRIVALAVCFLTFVATAQAKSPDESVTVYGLLENGPAAAERFPGAMHTLSGRDIATQAGETLVKGLSDQLPGSGLADSQGNDAFQDFHYRGFSASPLQGTAQGVAVYQDGARINEAFGDTVNWDAIPATAIGHMDLWSNNPVFGLNALGGAITIAMKNGFTWQGREISAQGGSYGEGAATLQYGSAGGGRALYASVEGLQDDGWRRHSASRIGRIYLDAGWRTGGGEYHLILSGAQSGLGVVGPTPLDWARADSAAVYTWPQATANRIAMVALRGRQDLSSGWRLSASAVLRALRQRHVDGNDADLEACSAQSSFGGDVCLEDDALGNPPGGKTLAFRDRFVIVNPAGQPLSYDPNRTYGTVDRTATDSMSEALALQLDGNMPVFGLRNQVTGGITIDHATIAFRSNSVLGRFLPDLSVRADPPGWGPIHTAGLVGYTPADLGASRDIYGAYLVDALDLTDNLTLTAGGRLNISQIGMRDRAGTAPELTGHHDYSRVNPLVGLAYRLPSDLTVYAGYSEATRMPTPLETDCSDRTRPCLLESSLVADPPLHQVVAQTYEAGLRGHLADGETRLDWTADLFRTDSRNDIIALASTIAGRGYYANVPLTRRQGGELALRVKAARWSVHASWSFLDATFQFTGPVASPNNPFADEDGNVEVTPGRHIPLTPAHQLRLGGDIEIMPGLTAGGNLAVTGSQYFDGDHANLDAKLPGYWTLGLRAAFRLNPRWQIFGAVENIFDRHDAAYGTYFDPGDAAGLTPVTLTNPRSITLERPVSLRAGLRVTL